MKIRNLIVATLFGLAAASGAQAVDAGVSVTCGDATLGIRTTTVNPADAGFCYAGLDNLGDPALVSLINSLAGTTDAEIIDRDDANTNGSELSITGVGGTSGTWSFLSSVWDDYDRLFLYFHFGDARDCNVVDCTGFETDPDIFVFELVRADSSGSWVFSCTTAPTCSLNGLSNIALIGTGDGPDEIPEPASLALVGLGLIAVAATRRRRRA